MGATMVSPRFFVVTFAINFPWPFHPPLDGILELKEESWHLQKICTTVDGRNPAITTWDA